ncbi:alpha-N-acetylglucosaminidase, partial [Streptomyces sp. CBMA123]|uniref:alpha-N-acetylglucosaminidase n=1 Tax=Streptomyces sp. CBMA123 TaxID=1896313 RepID=UPI001661BBA8
MPVLLPLLLVCAAVATAVGPVPAAPTAPGAAVFDPGPARAALGRLLPGHAAQFELVPEARPAPGGDGYTVSGPPGAIQVRGTSPATLLAGVGWYLRTVAHADIGLPGDSTATLPAVLPPVPAAHTGSAVVPHRYALNDTDAGYSGAYRGFADYQHEIDVLALHGFDEVLVTVGAEQPYHRALQGFGYGPDELRAWTPAPAHQPWWLLQNMSGFGGPVSEQLVGARAALGRRVCDQLRALGMTPVLPGYFGTVPADFARRNPGAAVVPQGTWTAFDRDSWLDPTSALFPRVAEAYYAAQREAFGDSALYKMDPLHEGGTAGGVDVPAAAGAIQRALLTAHPGAVWALLGWEHNPTAALLSGVDRSRMLIVDGLSDRSDGLDREADWGGTPYAFGTIPNFGGKTTFGANTGVWTRRFHRWRTEPGSALSGIAFMPEGTGTDPAALALFADLAWSPVEIDRSAWFTAYAAARYGGADTAAAAAWAQLRDGPYDMPSDGWSEPQDGLFTARPSLTATTTGSWSPPRSRFDPATVRGALDRLLRTAPGRRGTDAYRFDLVNLARQVLADESRRLLPLTEKSYTAQDLISFRSLVERWNGAEAELERVTATDPRFLVGGWLAQVPDWAATPAERDRLQYDARSILTTWGGTRAEAEDGGLHDYAAREWSGLVADLYAPRWAAYFASLDDALVHGTRPVPVDFFALDDAWAHSTARYPAAPVGDPVEAAAAVAAHHPVAEAGPGPAPAPAG